MKCSVHSAYVCCLSPLYSSSVNITYHLPARIFSFFIFNGFDATSVITKESVIENEPLLNLLRS
jgi:hypothetical protein